MTDSQLNMDLGETLKDKDTPDVGNFIGYAYKNEDAVTITRRPISWSQETGWDNGTTLYRFTLTKESTGDAPQSKA